MPSHDARISLRGAAIPTAAAGVVALAISTALVGSKGLVGALLATVLVMLFFASGQVALDRLTRNNPQMLMAGGLLVYTTQILLVGIVLAIGKRLSFFDHPTFGFTLLGCALIWTGFQVRAAMKAKIYYVQTDSGDKKESQSGRQP
ncbi:hypothetical protein [Kitasatospora sp. GP82]|uniref:hypothetical protein n=1 Tax=Kitasatospora sp. GP82 TaxID=3035089 RepID=UPI0024733074|nr:hypothetical protein [Kitasatospora sp. GP82]MDH6127972.1 ATP synthase protein I [Kitasatospora sp. GP82]